MSQSEEEYEPVPRPVVTVAILAIIVSVFVAMTAVAHGTMSSFPNEITDLFGAKINGRILFNRHIDQWWRIVTPIFIHGGLIHLCVNCYSLYILGRQIEPFYGSRRYFIIFMVSGICGALSSLMFSSAPSVGASGAIFGLVGAGIVFPLRFKSLIPADARRQIVRQLVQVAAINLAIGFGLKGIVDNAAHVGGLIGGGCAALFLLPDALDTREDRHRADAGVTAVCYVFALLIVATAGCQTLWALSPWWRVSIPAEYKLAGKAGQFQMEWLNKRTKTTIEITDTRHNPNLQQVALLLLFQANRDASNNHQRLKDGARVFQLRTPQGLVSDIALVAVYDRVVMIQAATTEAQFDVMDKQFRAVLNSFKIVHQPPPDLHSIPLVIKQPPGGVSKERK